MKSLAVRVLLGALLTLVIPGTALLASAVAPDEWLAFQTALRLIALVSALAGVGVTLLALFAGLAEGQRLAGRIVSDEGPRWEAATPHAGRPRRDPGARPSD